MIGKNLGATYPEIDVSVKKFVNPIVDSKVDNIVAQFHSESFIEKDVTNL